jgi:hypothetical protein
VELNSIVSGSALGWAATASADKTENILRSAGVWLLVNPQRLIVRKNISPIAQFADPFIWTVMKHAGIRGLYLTPVWGAGGLWDRGEHAAWGENNPQSYAEDIVQYDFAPAIGNDDEYGAVARSSRAAGSFVGGDLIPAATGIGPDFFLAVRGYRDYSGVYCLVEVPRESWSLLPDAGNFSDFSSGNAREAALGESPGSLAAAKESAELSETWRVTPLSAEQAAALAEAGIIPALLRQELLDYLPPSGWAATSRVRGTDGNLRRWVYRYFGESKRPVLNWTDPSATARQILNAGIIRQTGLLGNSLIGYSILPFIGLEGYKEGAESGKAHIMALEASDSLARQIRVYGGWSWLRDALPLPLVRDFLENGPDFIQDAVCSPFAEKALLTGDAGELRGKLVEALRERIDFRRLAHKGDFADATAAGLVAEAMGLKDVSEISLAQIREIIRGHKLWFFFMAMQPGALMLSDQDLVGSMPLRRMNPDAAPDKWWDKRMTAEPGSYSLLDGVGTVMVNAAGLPVAESLYGSLDKQAVDAESFLNNIGKMLRLRESLRLARTELAGTLKAKGKGVLGLVLRSEDEGFVICLSNFSRSASKEKLNPGEVAGLARALSSGRAAVVYGNLPEHSLGANALEFTIPGWEGAVIVVGPEK